MSLNVIEGLDRLGGQTAGGVLTVGNFDGVHLGHQKLLAAARELADQTASKLCVLTFDPAPAVLVDEDRGDERIVPVEQKHRLLGECGADMVVVVKTTREFLAMPPEQFVREVIAGKLCPRHVVEGHNFFFGRGRAGNLELLERMAPALGFEVTEVEPVMLDLPARGHVRVSSSLIRELIHLGEVGLAGECLSRPFTLCGRVVRGDQRGRALEHPTANVDPDGMIVPGDGVYAGRAVVEGVEWPAAVSIGAKPTFESSPRVIEAYLVGAEGDFYGLPIAVTFLARLRDQQKFTDVESLKAQMAKDVQRVREISR